MDVMQLADRSWPLLRRVMALHAVAYRVTGGRIGHRIPGLPQNLLLEHTGARTGARRTSPLLYFEDGADVVLVASKGGHPQHPAWYHNLRAHPDVLVQIGSERRPVRARIATPEERARLWPRAVEMYPAFADYQARTDRAIPLVILEPR